LVSGTSEVGIRYSAASFGFALLAALLGGKQVFFKLGQLAGAAQRLALTM
jgi:hypothetical protein